MNTTPIKTPTLAELSAAGYSVDVRHIRLFDSAYVDKDRIVLETIESTLPEMKGQTVGTVLRAKGGMTEVWVTDPKTSAEFYGFARCHPNDNYDKRIGIAEALKRVTGLMRTLNGTDGFKFYF